MAYGLQPESWPQGQFDSNPTPLGCEVKRFVLVVYRSIGWPAMGVARIVPYLESGDFDATKDFYVGVLGLTVAMEDPDGGDFLGLASAANPSAQIVVAAPGVEQPRPHLGIDVGDTEAVDAAHAEVVRRGLEVVYGPADEPWGIRRFFVKDPHGTVISILAHIAA